MDNIENEPGETFAEKGVLILLGYDDEDELYICSDLIDASAMSKAELTKLALAMEKDIKSEYLKDAK